jgi:CRP/FNR family cyclic AMP-dependent transcriptional regulator
VTELLRNVPLFADLTEAELAALRRFTVQRPVQRHTLLIQEGTPGDALYVILSGKVKVYLAGPDGKEVILAILAPGDFFGEMALIDDEPHSAAVMAMEPSLTCTITKRDFNDCLARHSSLAIRLLQNLSRRLRAADQKIAELALLDVEQRVRRTLAGLARPLDGRRVVEGRYTQQDIANMIGASREMVSRVFKDLAQSGAIRIESERIVLSDRLAAGR